MFIKSLAAFLLTSTAPVHNRADEAAVQAAVAEQLPSVKVTLQQGRSAAARKGGRYPESSRWTKVTFSSPSTR